MKHFGSASTMAPISANSAALANVARSAAQTSLEGVEVDSFEWKSKTKTQCIIASNRHHLDDNETNDSDA